MIKGLWRKIILVAVSLLLVLSYSMTSIKPLTASAVTDTELNAANAFYTTLADRTTKSDRITFDLWAKDANGKKIETTDIAVTNNGTKVNVNWDDSEKTSYTVNLTLGNNEIIIKVKGDTKATYTITQLQAKAGDEIGDYVMSVDAFTLGLGYIIEPQRMPIYKGQNAAQLLAAILAEKGFTYTSTGSLTSGFYLASITKKEGSIFDTPVNYPKELQDAGIDIDPDDHGKSLGEFDFNYMSGWMYKVNNVFPNVGFADSYLQADDVMTTQFTINYGSELGGGWTGNLFPAVNRDEVTRQIAYINSAGEWKEKFLQNKDIEAVYEEEHELMATFGIQQTAINDLVQRMEKAMAAYVEPMIEAAPETIDETNWQSIKDLVEVVENTTPNEQIVFSNINKYKQLKERYDQYEAVADLIAEIKQLKATDELTVTDDLAAVLHAQAAYEALLENYQALVENTAALKEKVAKMQALVNEKVATISSLIEALPSTENLALTDEELHQTITALIVELDDESKKAIANMNVFENSLAQMIVLKNNKKVADVIALIAALPAKENLLLTDEATVKAARSAYTALTSTLQKQVTNLAQLKEAETQITWFKAINSTIALITNLPAVESFDFSKETAVKNARTSYGKLSAEQQALVSNYEKLVTLEERIVVLQPVKATETLLNALPKSSSVQLTNKQKIEEARLSYDGLTADMQKIVQASYYKKLTDAEAKLTTLIDAENVKAINARIAALQSKEVITVDDAAEITAIKTLYQTLAEDYKTQITNYSEIEKFEAILNDISALQTTIEQLPEVENLTEAARPNVVLARQQYDALSQTVRQQITNYDKLVQLEAKLTELQAIADKINFINELIVNLPEKQLIDVTTAAQLTEINARYEQLTAEQQTAIKEYALVAQYEQIIEQLQQGATAVFTAIEQLNDASNRDEVQAVRAAYSDLTAGQKTLVTNEAKLTALELAIAEKDSKEVNTLVQLIAQLPKLEQITPAVQSKVYEITALYKKLTANNQARITNYSELQAIQEKLNDIEKNDLIAANKMSQSIAQLPKSITLKDKETVEKLQATYDALTIEQQSFITNYDVLMQAQITIYTLAEADMKAANKVISAIQTLPTTIKISHDTAITKVRQSYNNLTAAQKQLVTNLAALTTAESKLKKLKNSLLITSKNAQLTVPTITNTMKKISGTASKTMKVYIYKNNKLLKSVKATNAGKYSIVIAKQKKGTVLTFVLKNEANETVKTVKKTVQAAKVKAPTTLKATTKKVTGKATAGNKVTVYKGSKKIGTATVSKKGAFTIKISKQKKGTKLTVYAFDTVKNKSAKKTVKIK